ncbi:MAG TPA: calcium-binding protein [Ramlibacter sp.]|jgi:Ca2+-binding RTX toxin-like protein|nr:calcium-binding protein [Ramlibacter sp.]
MRGTKGNDSLIGGVESDYIWGDDGNDSLYGGGNNDHLAGGAGNDYLDGGSSYDAAVYDFSSMTTSVSFTGTLNLNAGSSTQADGLGGTDTLVGVESLEIFGGSAADQLTGSMAQDLLEGGGGNDVLAGGSERDTFAFDTARAGELGIDRITDLGVGDTIMLRNFQFNTSGGLTTGDGSALWRNEMQLGAYDAATNTTMFHVGVDDQYGADLSISLTGQFTASQFSRGIVYTANYSYLTLNRSTPGPSTPPSAVTYQGTAAADSYTGGAGNDIINGVAGSDTLYGGAGDDRIDGGASGDKLYGGEGNDYVFGDIGRDRIEGNDGHDTLVAGGDNDWVFGGEGADWLQGDAGDDQLTGGGGDDFLVGGTGIDTLVGNAGADTFFFDAGSGQDRLEFFWVSHDDKIQIRSNVNGSGILTAQDAYAHTTDTADGAMIDLGGGNTVVLVGVQASAISAAVFEIV